MYFFNDIYKICNMKEFFFKKKQANDITNTIVHIFFQMCTDGTKFNDCEMLTFMNINNLMCVIVINIFFIYHFNVPFFNVSTSFCSSWSLSIKRLHIDNDLLVKLKVIWVS